MFKKRKFNQRRQVADGNDGSNKRAKNDEDSNLKSEDSEEESLNLANFKKQKMKEKNGDKCLMASTIDERAKKQKVWGQKYMVNFNFILSYKHKNISITINIGHQTQWRRFQS